MNKRKVAGIKGAIDKWVAKNSLLWVSYGNWYVGMTAMPAARKSQHNSSKFFNVSYWKSWDAGSVEAARAIEDYFGSNGKGMKGGAVLGGVSNNSTFVYVYK